MKIKKSEKFAHVKNGEILHIGSFNIIQPRLVGMGGRGVPLLSLPPSSKVGDKVKSEYEHVTKTGNGHSFIQSNPPSDTFFRKKSEGRSQPERAHRAKEIKFKEAIWPQATMINFFRQYAINARTTDWLIAFHEPSRKMTQDDQIILLLGPDSREYHVSINRDKRKMIIRNLYGEQ